MILSRNLAIFDNEEIDRCSEYFLIESFLWIGVLLQIFKMLLNFQGKSRS